MTTTTTSPALEQAAALYALAEHLVEYPQLMPVNVTRTPSAPVQLQIAAYPHIGEQKAAPALLPWAKSLDGCRIWLEKHAGNVTEICVEGVIDGITIHVWDLDYGDLYRWRGTERRTPITLEQLTAYVAAGTVEHADEHTAATS
jgi:hypothetical protein